jgi:ATP/maltotriose-dependent transcriptional regulator MalT
VVHRQRLNSRLRSGDRPSLTLVSAPAGFGKTTLLTEWFGSSPDQESSAAWLSLDARDNDPTLFWSYVVAALQAVAPERREHVVVGVLRGSNLVHQPQRLPHTWIDARGGRSL